MLRINQPLSRLGPFEVRIPSVQKLFGGTVIAVFLFVHGGAFADDIISQGVPTQSVVDHAQNLGVALLISYLWIQDSRRKDAFIDKLFDKHNDEKHELLEIIKALKGA